METREGKKRVTPWEIWNMAIIQRGSTQKRKEKKREINNSRTATVAVAVAASMGAWSRTEPTTAEATDGFGVRGGMIDRERAPELKVEDRGQGSRT